MKGPMRFLLAAALLLPAAACSNVESEQMLGTPLADEEAAGFAGVWLHNDVMPIYVAHRGGGAVHFAVVTEKENSFELHEFDGVLTQDEGTVYLNVEKQADADDVAVTYQFLRLSRLDRDTYYAHPANDDGFAAAVEAGRLSGRVETSEGAGFMPKTRTIHLDATAEELANFVRPDKASEQFNLEWPMYLHRLTEFDTAEE